MAINSEILRKIELDYSHNLGEEVAFEYIKPISGGSINNAAEITSNNKSYFLKWNSSLQFVDMFSKEILGLDSLKACNCVNIPKPVFQGSFSGGYYLLLDFIESGENSLNGFNKFGKLLAKQHKVSNPNFGFPHDNYIGSLHQANKFQNSWEDFFYLNRLEPLIKMAVDSAVIDRSLVAAFEHFAIRISDIFPMEAPALLHGDLWSGNFLFDKNGEPYIFDPATYYGHREMDLAMSKLFGGFDYSFYQSYNEEFPLEKAWEERVDYCNLYPLLVHANLFGSSYVYDIKRILKKHWR